MSPSLLPLPLTLTLLLLAAAASQQQERPVVHLSTGSLRGVTERSFSGRPVAAFRGVPYAQPPVGELRFAAPRPHAGWPGERDAARHGASCLQYNILANFTKTGVEDCLFANVYSPRLPAAAGEPRRPVMVWVHGGGFISGSGDDDLFGVDYLLDEDVVVVTFNYRLGVFGFLTTEDAAAPGNLGLLDQVAALRWVRRHIAAFGGDPELVTVFGESAGGASVSLLVASPLAAGLFHRAVSQSGAAAACWSLAGDQRPQLAALLAALDCPPAGTAALDCVRRRPADDIMAAISAHGFDAAGLKMQFHPRVDTDAAEPFLPEQPNVLLQRGSFNRVPWMMGTTLHEGLFILGFVHKSAEFLQRAQAGELAAWASAEVLCGQGLTADTVSGGADPLQVAARIRDHVAAGGEPTAALIDLFSDRFFTLSVLAEAELAAQHVPVYQYLLDHVGAGQQRFTEMLGLPAPPVPLVSHGDDLPYLFLSAAARRPEPGSPEHALVRLFVTLWTGFARRGYPSSGELGSPAWPLFTPERRRYLRLNDAPAVAERPFEERLQFWRSLPLREPWNAHLWPAEAGHDEL